MKLAVYVSNQAFMNKAAAVANTGGFKEGWAASPLNLTVEEIAEKWLAGYSILPAQMKRNKEAVNNNWVSQQMFAMDFDNENGDKERVSDECYIQPEEARNMAAEAGLNPAFIYSSFSSTPEHQKFRMVFVLDEKVTTRELHHEVATKLYTVFMKDGYIVADIQCSDRSRIYYGGKELLFADFQAVTRLSQIKALGTAGVPYIGKLRSNRDFNGNRINDYIPVSLMRSEQIRGITTPAIAALLHNDPLQLRESLLNGVDSTLQIIRNTCTVHANMNPYHVIKHLPLHLILGVPLTHTFRCIMHGHEDAHPSAKVQPLADGTYVYFCHRCYGEGNGQTLIDLILEASKCSLSDTITFVEAAFDISIQTKHQRLCRTRCNNILNFIHSARFTTGVWEPLFRHMKRKKLLGHYQYYLEKAMQYAAPEPILNEGVPTFYESVRESSEHMAGTAYCTGVDKNSVSKKRNELADLGLIGKSTNLDNPTFSTAKAYQTKQGNQYHKEFLFIPDLTEEILEFALQEIRAAKSNGERAKYKTRAALMNSRADAADRVFKQDVGSELRKFKRDFLSFMMNAVFKLAIKGWTTEEEIIQEILRTSQYSGVKWQVGQLRPYITNGNRYTLETVSKDLRTKLNLPDTLPTRKKIIVPANKNTIKDSVDRVFNDAS